MTNSEGTTAPPMPETAFAIIAQVRAKPGKEAELRAETLPLVDRARSEPTTLLFYLHENIKAPGHLILYEIYASKQDHDAHVAQPHVQAWFARLPNLTEHGVGVIHMGLIGPR